MDKQNLLKQAELDRQSFEKLSAFSPEGLAMAKDLLKPFVGTLAAVSAAGGLSYLMAKNDEKNHHQAMLSSFKHALSSNPEFQKNEPQFQNRFSELMTISPTIAKNPIMASKIIEKKFSTGFDVDDIHKLTSIEINAANTKHLPTPSSAARSAAMKAFGGIFNVFGHDVIYGLNPKIQHHNQMIAKAHKERDQKSEAEKENFADWYADRVEALMETGMSLDQARAQAQKEAPTMVKKSSSNLKVSEETPGEMLAERAVMLKTAGFADMLKPGVQALGHSFAYMAPALALGGGAALIANVLESRRNAALSEQADRNFKAIKSQSDVIQGDVSAATEAFETLKAFAPSLAARPQVAKTFVENVVRAGMLAPDTISAIADAENKVRGVSQPKGGFLQNFKSNVDVVKGVSDFVQPKAGDAEKFQAMSYKSQLFGKKK